MTVTVIDKKCQGTLSEKVEEIYICKPALDKKHKILCNYLNTRNDSCRFKAEEIPLRIKSYSK